MAGGQFKERAWSSGKLWWILRSITWSELFLVATFETIRELSWSWEHVCRKSLTPLKACSWELLRSNAFDQNIYGTQKIALGQCKCQISVLHKWVEHHLGRILMTLCKKSLQQSSSATPWQKAQAPDDSFTLFSENECLTLSDLLSKFLATIQLQPLTKGPDYPHTAPGNWMSCPQWAITRNVRVAPEGRCCQTQGWSLLIVLSTLVSP